MPSPQLPDRDTVTQLTTFLRERRSGKTGVVLFDEVEDRHRGTVPVVAGELLIRTADLQQASVRPALRKLVPQWTSVTALGGALTRILLPAWQRPRLREILAQLHGLPVAPNALVLTGGIVWKAAVTPEHAAAPASRPDPAGGTPIRVAALDTGITDQTRTDRWLDGLLRPDNVDPLDTFPVPDGYLDVSGGHGTFVAGLVRQLAPDADLQIFRVVDSDGLGSEVDVAEALVRVVRGGAQVVNMSLGVETFDDEPPLAFTVALEQLADVLPDVLLIAAAGNSGTDRPSYPAACTGVVAVAATTASLQNAAWSSRGPWVTCSTAGEDVRSTYVAGTEDPAIDPEPETFGQNAWASWAGTSFAAPQVAGQVARIAQERGVTVRKALDVLLAGAERIDPNYGKVLRIALPA